MITRAATTASAPTYNQCPGQDREAHQGQLRRAKSSPTAIHHIPVPATTRSDRLTPLEMQAQARAAAAQAFKNDLLRKGDSLNEGKNHHRGQSIRFGQTPLDITIQAFHPHPSQADVFLQPERHPTDRQGSHLVEDSPHRLYNPTYITTAPSSYRRLRRSRSLFSMAQPKAYDSVNAPERSMTYSGNNLQPRRSMSFLRGGTDFMPSSYRRDLHQTATKERKPLHYFGSSSSRGDKTSASDAAHLEKPRSLRMKVRRMSASVVNSVRRAFLVGSGKEEQPPEMPVQHVVSNRPYFGDYSTLSDRQKQASIDSAQEVFLSQVNSGAPSLRKVPSSIGYPSRSGSIRIVTPPTRNSTPLSSSGNTWATSTASTLRSGTGSKRLSIIREATPKNDGERDNDVTPTRARNKALDTQRVYSAFLRVSRAKNAEFAQELARMDSEVMPLGEELPRSPSVQSHSTTRSIIKKNVTFNEDPFQSHFAAGEPSSSALGVDGDKENTPPASSSLSHRPSTSRTHITIGPRITLYPLPTAVAEGHMTDQTNLTSKDGGKSDDSMKSLRHAHSAFFPYSEGQLLGGSTPSPYKRATAMSPDVPSIYSRTTSGETPKPFMDANTPRPPTPFEQDDSQFVQLGRRVSLKQMKKANDSFIAVGIPSAPTPSNTPGSYYTAKTKKDENVPFSTYIPGLIRPGENFTPETNHYNPSTTASSFGLSFFRTRQSNSRRVTVNGENSRLGTSEPSRKPRVLTSKPFQSLSPAPLESFATQPLSKIDSNAHGVMDSEGSRKNNWGLGIGKRLLSHSKSLNSQASDASQLFKGVKESLSVCGSENSLIASVKEDQKSSSRLDGAGDGNSYTRSPKFSFEANDDRVLTTTPLGDRNNYLAAANLKASRVRGPRALVRTGDSERRNSSVSSVGAFL